MPKNVLFYLTCVSSIFELLRLGLSLGLPSANRWIQKPYCGRGKTAENPLIVIISNMKKCF